MKHALAIVVAVLLAGCVTPREDYPISGPQVRGDGTLVQRPAYSNSASPYYNPAVNHPEGFRAK